MTIAPLLSKNGLPNEKYKHFVQPKLAINTPSDIYEQEADAMADKVMRLSADETMHQPQPGTGLIGRSVQRKCSKCEEEEEKKNPIMRKAENGSPGIPVSSSFSSSLNASKGGGSPIPTDTRNFMENTFSTDFSGVRIHTDRNAAEMSSRINAKAFTHGSDIYFNKGQYNPGSAEGKHLLAHELVHTLQQDKINKRVQRECGDKADHWYNPFIRIASYDSTCLIQYANLDMNSITNITTEWSRNALNTGLVSAVAGMATTIIGRRLGLSQLAALIFGGAVGGARGYAGMTAKERVRGQTINMSNWYGRYKYHVLRNEILAVDFQGKSTNVISLVTPWYFEEALFDANNNIIGNYIHKNKMYIPGVDISNAHSLPETSFGEI
ncbi:MAG: DUF4157 domain-containing protein [Aequorivita sp.]